jgi:hypothetical protein
MSQCFITFRCFSGDSGGFLDFGVGVSHRWKSREFVSQAFDVFVYEEPQVRNQDNALSIVLTHRQLLAQLADLFVIRQLTSPRTGRIGGAFAVVSFTTAPSRTEYRAVCLPVPIAHGESHTESELGFTCFLCRFDLCPTSALRGSDSLSGGG